MPRANDPKRSPLDRVVVDGVAPVGGAVGIVEIVRDATVLERADELRVQSLRPPALQRVTVDEPVASFECGRIEVPHVAGVRRFVDSWPANRGSNGPRVGGGLVSRRVADVHGIRRRLQQWFARKRALTLRLLTVRGRSLEGQRRTNDHRREYENEYESLHEAPPCAIHVDMRSRGIEACP